MDKDLQARIAEELRAECGRRRISGRAVGISIPDLFAALERLGDLVREVWGRLTEAQSCPFGCCAGDVYGETGHDQEEGDLP